MMWLIRFVLFGLSIAQVGAFGYFLKHRQKYEKLLENRAVNLGVVIVYNLLCYLMVGLPSDPSVVSPPAFFVHPGVRIGFSVFGLVLMALAVLVGIISVGQRKALGGQNVEAGLLTSGIYRYFRHPIYTGIIWISLALALATKNWDGLLMFPAVLLMNIAEAIIEERYDVGVRFPSQYQAYRKRTRMLGPIWCWAVILASLPVVAGVPYLS
jgi:protein-S-isoprenylcysteine O-methyltransferase Ste14